MAYLLEKTETPAPKVRALPDSATQLRNMLQMADSLVKVADSIRKQNQRSTNKRHCSINTC